MLVLTRKIGQRIILRQDNKPDIVLMLVNIDAPDRTARIGIVADPSLTVIREELLPKIGEVS